jgi:RNA-directed DNA polymerase
MEPYVVGLLVVFVVILIFILCIFGLKTSQWKYHEKSKRRKWNKYVQSLDPEKQKEIYQIIKSSTNDEMDQFLLEIEKKLKYRYDPYTFSESTILKRSIYTVVNKYTEDFDPNRLKKIENIFPMLKRVYFGPQLNNKIYNKRTLKRKFIFFLKSGQKIPQLNSILDISLFLNTSVNKILALCYMQRSGYNFRYSAKYIKNRKIYEALKLKDQIERTEKFSEVELNPTFKISENSKFDKTTEKKNRIDSEKNEESEPIFEEKNSPFYKRKFLVKPDGRRRLIACPAPFLKNYQKKILTEILEKAEISNACTGFMKNKSIVTNAKNHIQAQTVVKIDLKNFFNSMKFKHVFEVFRGFGYNRPVSGILACICTDWYGSGGRYVPQGAPSSPMIGNLYASHLDKRLEGLWSKKGFSYSRYADDLTFSSHVSKIKVRNLIHASYQIIKDEKLYPNFTKTKVLRKQHKKSITGITVNEKININRNWMNDFRGELHRYAKFGLPEDPSIKRKTYNHLKGKFAFLKMVSPEKAAKYQNYLDRINTE